MQDTEEKDTKFVHNVYKNDPILFADYIGKEVKVNAKDGITHSGVVYTIDPVSERCVLKKKSNFYSSNYLPHLNCKQMTIQSVRNNVCNTNICTENMHTYK